MDLLKNKFTLEAATSPRYGVDSRRAFPKNPGSLILSKSFLSPTLPTIEEVTARAYATRDLMKKNTSDFIDIHLVASIGIAEINSEVKSLVN